MRSRTVREGSVGLLLLLGIGLFAGLVLWLQDVYFGKRNYQFTVTFKNAGGMQIGTPVRYRGVTVGKVKDIKADYNQVYVQIEITQPNLAIPRDVVIQTNESGLIGENSIEITPTKEIQADVQGVKPTDANCKERQLIICNNASLEGQVGVGLDELISSAVKFANFYTDPQFYNNVNTAVTNTSKAAEAVVSLSRDLSTLSQSLRQDLGNISATTTTIGRTVDRFAVTAEKLNVTADKFNVTADKIGRTADVVSGQFGVTANKIGRTADQITAQFGVTTNKLGRTADQISVATNQLTSTAKQTADRVNATADEFRLAAGQVNGLVTNLNSLITNNQGAIVATLDNLKQTSDELRLTVSKLSPAVNRVTQGELIRNLETLSANAVQASENLRNLSNSLNNPTTLVSLQQTLDSARVTFQNAQKITSDVDDLIGDPTFRNNLRNLVNGLSGLVSSTQQLQQQVEVAQFLEPMADATNLQMPKMPNVSQMGHFPADTPAKDKPNFPNPDRTAARKDEKPLSEKSAYTND